MVSADNGMAKSSCSLRSNLENHSSLALVLQWRIQDFPNGGALFCHKWGGAHPVFR